MIERARKRLSKRAKKGFRGWPLATVALYGPDDSTATKLTVGIVPAEDAEATDLQRWFSKEQTDIRDDIRATEEVLAFITDTGAKSVVMTDRIIGCPHEEGIDYEGATCPACLFCGRDGTAGPANACTSRNWRVCFLSVHAAIRNTFNVQCHLTTRRTVAS